MCNQNFEEEKKNEKNEKEISVSLSGKENNFSKSTAIRPPSLHLSESGIANSANSKCLQKKN